MRWAGAIRALAAAGLLGCASVSSPDAKGAAPESSGTPETALSSQSTLALVGGTILDLERGGSSTADLHDAVVLIRGGEIVAAGPRATTTIPRDARVVDVSGTYLVPGLHDVFAGLNSQAQANAYLYEGVTSIVGSDEPGGRRGALVENASPSPRIRRLGFIHGMSEEAGTAVPLDTAGIMAQVESEVSRGAKVLLIHYRLEPDQTRRVVARARELGLATIGELGMTTYSQGIDAGLDAFVHVPRYSLELAPPDLRKAVAADPFGPPRIAYYEYLTGVDPDGPVVKGWAERLGTSPVALIPTLSLSYYDLPEHDNPWKEPIAAILDPNGIYLPVDRETGAREPRPGMTAAAPNLFRIEERYRRAGAHYLAGSGTSAFGTLPGIALHLELRLLTRIGLTPRQALAAATSNVAETFRWPKTGKIAAGNDADLVVLDTDPTVDIRNLERIRLVLLGGAVVDRDALLRSAARP